MQRLPFGLPRFLCLFLKHCLPPTLFNMCIDHRVCIPTAYPLRCGVLCPWPSSNPTPDSFSQQRSDDPNAAWKNKIKWYSENNHFKELNRMPSMQTEFEWKIFPEFMTLGILEEIQKLMEGIYCEFEHFNDRIIFMSMCNDNARGENGNTEECIQNSVPLRSLVIFGTWIRKEMVRTYSDKPDGNWDRTAEMINTPIKYRIRSPNISCIQCL